jgi:hypothetical protein
MQGSQLLKVSFGISTSKELQNELSGFYPPVYSLKRTCDYEQFAKYCNRGREKLGERLQRVTVIFAEDIPLCY